MASERTKNRGARRARRRKDKREGKITACEPACVECSAIAELVGGARIYPHRPDLHAKSFWLCRCGAYVGCHRGTTIPLGRPAGPETRKARNEAHATFDPLWRAKMVKDGVKQHEARGAGYRWLAEQMGMEPEACHIGWMTAAEARRVVEICAPFLARAA